MSGASRVYEIAQQFNTDTNTVIDLLRDRGVTDKRPESRLDSDVAMAIRAALTARATARAAELDRLEVAKLESASAAFLKKSKAPRTAALPEAQIVSAQIVNKRKLAAMQTERTESRRFAAPGPLREQQRQFLLQIIPSIYAALRGGLDASPGHQSRLPTLVVMHDRSIRPAYSVRTLAGELHECFLPGSAAARMAVAPLQQSHNWYRERDKDGPNAFIAFDLEAGHAWTGKTLDLLREQRHSPVVDAVTLEPIATVTVPTIGESPRLASKAQLFRANDAPDLREKISTGTDLPEEAFLLREDLLRLAVDSLDGAELLAPLPVHVNAVWIFERPIVMQRSDGSDRHVRAVWFRQGGTMWRMRTYTAGSRMKVKQVGEQLSGHVPFVPVWDETRPEQKLIAAIWALMSQGGVTESERVGPGLGDVPASAGWSASELTLVRVKAGTNHALVYQLDGIDRADHADSLERHFHWSVRGHWRHQPYASLGRDEDGRTKTKPIWIASYVKGAPTSGDAVVDSTKVIIVGA
jgi:hypothetical protein